MADIPEFVKSCPACIYKQREPFNVCPRCGVKPAKYVQDAIFAANQRTKTALVGKKGSPKGLSRRADRIVAGSILATCVLLGIYALGSMSDERPTSPVSQRNTVVQPLAQPRPLPPQPVANLQAPQPTAAVTPAMAIPKDPKCLPSEQTFVQGYTRTDGIYVQGYWRCKAQRKFEQPDLGPASEPVPAAPPVVRAPTPVAPANEAAIHVREHERHLKSGKVVTVREHTRQAPSHESRGTKRKRGE